MTRFGPRGFVRDAVRVLLTLCLILIASAASAATAPPERTIDQLTLLVPAAAGGGWDLTARAMKVALENEGLARNVRIVRLPGAGGLIGLNQFVELYHGRGDVLLVGGLVMMGSAIRDQAAVNLNDVTPVARLTGDWEVLAVPRDSPITSVSKLREMMARHPGRLRWAGGALGGTDQGLIWSLAEQIGTPIDEILYYAKAGGHEVARSVVEGRSDIGVSGYAELEPALAGGKLRLLAVAAPRRIDGVAAPTLGENGLDVTTMNWRAVFAPPGLDRMRLRRLNDLVQAMAASRTWRSLLQRERWTDTYLAGSPLSRFIDGERSRWARVIDPPARTNNVMAVLAGDATATNRFIAGIMALGSCFIACLGWLSTVLRRRGRDAALLRDRCLVLATRLDETSTATTQLIQDGIQEDFGEWNLSFAERDIAWFMLRGLPLKQIADLRGTSERTVRQQAQAIYRKAGLEGRSDLAGRVLERFI